MMPHLHEYWSQSRTQFLSELIASVGAHMHPNWNDFSSQKNASTGVHMHPSWNDFHPQKITPVGNHMVTN